MPNHGTVRNLKPCPFCGSHDVAIMREGKSEENASYRVVCRQCLTRGPKHWVRPWHYGNKFIAQGKAITAWNKRFCSARPTKADGVPLSEIIRSLEAKAQDKNAQIPADEPDSICAKDAAAFRAAAGLLREVCE